MHSVELAKLQNVRSTLIDKKLSYQFTIRSNLIFITKIWKKI